MAEVTPEPKPDNMNAASSQSIVEIWQNMQSSFYDFFIDLGTYYQLAIIGVSFIIASFLYRALRGSMQTSIDDSSLPLRVKRLATNLKKLVQPLIALALIFIMTQASGHILLGDNILFSESIMKVLLAWIAIRIAVQFIDNNLVRNIFAMSIWIVAALSIFGLLDQTTLTLDAIGFSIGEFRLSALAIIKGTFYIFALLYLALFASTFAERKVLQVKSLKRSSQVLVAKIIRVILIVIALLIGLTSSGIDLSLFAVFGGAVGLGVGFGLQKGISNLFSGMLLLLDRSIEPGDVIELEGGTFGWVDHMGARYTEVVTRDNKSYLIPNEDFITGRVVNWSHGSSLIRVQVEFGVDYKQNPHEVKAIAEEAAAKPERVCAEPKPVCHLVEFGDSSLNFKLRFWIKDAEKGVTNMRGNVMLCLWDAFKEHGIDIPYPHREVYIHQAAKAKFEAVIADKPAPSKNKNTKTPKKKTPQPSTPNDAELTDEQKSKARKASED